MSALDGVESQSISLRTGESKRLRGNRIKQQDANQEVPTEAQRRSIKRQQLTMSQACSKSFSYLNFHDKDMRPSNLSNMSQLLSGSQISI